MKSPPAAVATETQQATTDAMSRFPRPKRGAFCFPKNVGAILEIDSSFR